MKINVSTCIMLLGLNSSISLFLGMQSGRILLKSAEKVLGNFSKQQSLGQEALFAITLFSCYFLISLLLCPLVLLLGWLLMRVS